MAENVRINYDACSMRGDKARPDAMTRFHNRLKQCLISKSAGVAGDTQRVLDIGCGKGGDIMKWMHAGARSWEGCDISDDSLSRLRERIHGSQGIRVHAPQLSWARSDALSHLRRQPAHSACVVSFQFSLHHCCRSKEELTGVLRASFGALRPGGCIVASYPEATAVGALMGHRSNYFHVLPVHTYGHQMPQGFFRPYSFFLTGHVDQGIEFAIPHTQLLSIASQVGFECAGEGNHEWVTKDMGGDSPPHCSEEQLKVSRMYAFCILRKAALGCAPGECRSGEMN